MPPNPAEHAVAEGRKTAERFREEAERIASLRQTAGLGKGNCEELLVKAVRDGFAAIDWQPQETAANSRFTNLQLLEDIHG